MVSCNAVTFAQCINPSGSFLPRHQSGQRFHMYKKYPIVYTGCISAMFFRAMHVFNHSVYTCQMYDGLHHMHVTKAQSVFLLFKSSFFELKRVSTLHDRVLCSDQCQKMLLSAQLHSGWIRPMHVAETRTDPFYFGDKVSCLLGQKSTTLCTK